MDTLLILFNTHWKVTDFCELLRISHLYVIQPMFIYLVRHYISVSKRLSSGVIISYVYLYFSLPFLVSYVRIFCCLSHIKIFSFFFFSIPCTMSLLITKGSFVFFFQVPSLLFPQPFTYSIFYLFYSALYIYNILFAAGIPTGYLTFAHLGMFSWTLSLSATLSIKTLTFLPVPSFFCTHSEIQSSSSLHAKISYKNVVWSI